MKHLPGSLSIDHAVHAEPALTPKRQGTADAARDDEIKAPLRRFTRKVSAPAELEILRYNLIAARVMQGMTPAEATERFHIDFDDHVELDRIEAGKDRVPITQTFLKQVATFYAVSTDWLLGLSPHTEIDGKVAQQYALARGIERHMRAVARQYAKTAAAVADEQPTREDLEHVVAAVDCVDQALAGLRAKGAFDDLPGGAPLVAAVERVIARVEPLRRRLKQFKTLDEYMADALAGRMPAIGYLNDLYTRRELSAAILDSEAHQ